MEEKKYPVMNEEESVGIAREPIAEVAEPVQRSVDGVTEVHDWIDDLDWERFPSFGPFSEEEAIARIEEAERDLQDPTKWISSEEAWAHLYNRFPWLR